MCYMWGKIQYAARWNPETRLKAAARAINLAQVKKIVISLDPFYKGNTSLREFWYHVTNPEIKETNPEARVVANVRNDGKEPYFVAELKDERKIVFKTEGMLSSDVIMRFNRLLGNPEIGNLRIEHEKKPPENWQPFF
ncbi:Mitochondrial Ribosomal Protein, Large [Ditylenchus destructor]|nr:Mitochondrial Ribosomal Protein, Large [Ditylenchus destructor]